MGSEPQEIVGMRVEDLNGSDFFRGIAIPAVEFIGDEGYMEFRQMGVSLVLPDGVAVSSVHLHADNHDGYVAYRGDMPRCIGFFMGRNRVRESLGKPIQSGGGKKVPILGYIPEWDKFSFGSNVLHVEYSHGNMSIRLVTISAS